MSDQPRPLRSNSVNFAFGVMHFNPPVHQQHPPINFLYICGGGRTRCSHDPNLALVPLSTGCCKL
jgi:hypothetical protein